MIFATALLFECDGYETFQGKYVRERISHAHDGLLLEAGPTISAIGLDEMELPEGWSLNNSDELLCKGYSSN